MADNTEILGLGEEAIDLVRVWLEQVGENQSASDKKLLDRLRAVIVDQSSLHFVMQFVDRVIRPDKHPVSAKQFRRIVADRGAPSFLSKLDKVLLKCGAQFAPWFPSMVMPLAKGRMRSIVGHLIAPAEPGNLEKHLSEKRGEGYALNVNLLGEAVLGEREASRRLNELLRLIEEPGVDYVSVKISAVASQLNHWAYGSSLARVSKKLQQLVTHAASVTPKTFINFDMEEYHDLDLTVDAFKKVMGQNECLNISAGIVLQAYLPDSYEVLQDLCGWANRRHENGGAPIKIRLVKGANLAMERVDAAIHGWKQAPYSSKLETDANYKRCLDWMLQPERMSGLRLGVASHNLFDVAWTHLLSKTRGVDKKVQFEMLQGMAPSHATAVANTTSYSGNQMLLYTPAVRTEDFDVAISYLFRRLEENASDENFLRHLFELATSETVFDSQKDVFLKSLAMMKTVISQPRRLQDRAAPNKGAYAIGEKFVNEPETDTVLRSNRHWIDKMVNTPSKRVKTTLTNSSSDIDLCLERARRAQSTWQHTSPKEKQDLLHRVADQIARCRDEFFVTMRDEGKKTMHEADAEICEAIDFARYYGDRAREFEKFSSLEFKPLGVVAVIPPWNFPVAIPCGGVFAALAAGNAAILKPAPQTPRCAELIHEVCQAAELPADLVQFVRTPDNQVGQRLVTASDAVILTGGSETAELFQSWKPDIKLFAETSGKNALIVTPHADIDLAVADLVQSAFGHSGQKCSAASLGILVGDVYASPRFRRQLIDAVESIEVGQPSNIETNMGPIIESPNIRLKRGLETLDDGEAWLVEPKCLDPFENLWSPGVKDGVQVDSWFHRTECFGPVLGLMKAESLEEAIHIQNSSLHGLTGGIHSLDPGEIANWKDRVEVGNAYINRPITGAIVQRQPFGGWKRSAVGPGAKAGGPNYVFQLGTWREVVEVDNNFEESWNTHFNCEHDPTGLFCESNVFRYRPLEKVIFRIGESAPPADIDKARCAAKICGSEIVESWEVKEESSAFLRKLVSEKVERVRFIDCVPNEKERKVASEQGIYLDDSPVLGEGRIELQRYLKEQAISQTMHRFGNLVL